VRVFPFIATIALALTTPVLAQQDWPQFRGPDGQGHATAPDVPLQWSETQNVRWKAPVPGRGWSSPVVSNGRIWVTTATTEDGSGQAPAARASGGGAPRALKEEVSLRALAFDLETGRELVNVEVFRVKYPRAINEKNSRASATPVLDGDRVYVHFGADGTAALTTTGEVVWKAQFAYESQHGGGGSPIVFGDLLIFNCDGSSDAFVVALDKATGKVRWKTDRRQPADQAYTTPLAIRVGDKDQIVSVGAYRAAAYDPQSGKEIWRVGYADGFSNVPRPVYGHGLVYIATGFQQPTLIAVRADGTGDVTGSHVAWTLRRAAPLTPSPLLVGDELYIVSDSGIASCLDAKTGTLHWQKRLDGGFSASPLLAAGRIYFLSEQGTATVIKPSKTFEPLATNTIDGITLASIAVSDGNMIIRSERQLYCIAGPAGPRESRRDHQ
jgi:outer membrane protein assembly factor BamB